MNVTSGGGDSLTRTTLQIDGAMSRLLNAAMIHALQRVPGVLLADVDTATAQAIVAHDGAVPTASLVSAALRAGVATHILAAAPIPAAPAAAESAIAATVRKPRPREFLVMGAMVAIVFLIDAFVPNSPQKRYMLEIDLLAIWVFFFATALPWRRR